MVMAHYESVSVSIFFGTTVVGEPVPVDPEALANLASAVAARAG